jgi:hypothetical protein
MLETIGTRTNAICVAVDIKTALRYCNTGIQDGHENALNNILNQFEPDMRRITIRNHFKNQSVSHSAVVDLLKL